MENWDKKEKEDDEDYGVFNRMLRVIEKLVDVLDRQTKA